MSRLFTTQRYSDDELELRDGDRVLLFTDGVSEARDGAENDFGEERLEKVVIANRQSSARGMVDRVVEEVSSFSGGRTDDDLTLVGVAVRKLA